MNPLPEIIYLYAICWMNFFFWLFLSLLFHANGWSLQLQHANEDVEKMILGNKCDMTDKRVVTKDRGEAVSYPKSNAMFAFTHFEVQFSYLKCLLLLSFQIAREHGIRFMETSAKANINIERAFAELAEAILTATSGKNNTEHPERVVVDRRGQEKQPAYKSCCA